MTFIAGAVLWAAYTAVWWGWEAVTNRVPDGPPDTFHWPSLRDLVSPGRMAAAVPPQMVRPTAGSATTNPGSQGVDAKGNPLTGTPGKPGGAPLQTAPQPGKYGSA